jgi:hypothetical protein
MAKNKEAYQQPLPALLNMAPLQINATCCCPYRKEKGTCAKKHWIASCFDLGPHRQQIDQQSGLLGFPIATWPSFGRQPFRMILYFPGFKAESLSYMVCLG